MLACMREHEAVPSNTDSVQTPPVFVTNRHTSLKVQDTALPLLSTIGRLMISRPPWNSTSEGSCLARGEVLTLYLFREKNMRQLIPVLRESGKISA